MILVVISIVVPNGNETSFKMCLSDPPDLVTLKSTVTSALDEGRYVWDLITTDGSGIKTRRIEGRATVTPSVTR